MDPEIAAIDAVYRVLKDLDDVAQTRVIEYVTAKLRRERLPLDPQNIAVAPLPRASTHEGTENSASGPPAQVVEDDADDAPDQEGDGISPIAKKWMRRNGLSSADLSSHFSLGIEEIDLVAKKVPGKSKRERMLNVFLLKGIAAYLGGGAARFDHESVKQACTHYDAYDMDNFAAYLKSFAAQVSGTKEKGYALTARGLTDATELVKTMAGKQKAED